MAILTINCSSFKNNYRLIRSFKRFSSNVNEITPKTVQQVKYDEFLNNPQIKLVIGNGPAGTGKTLLACKNAIRLFQSNISIINWRINLYSIYTLLAR